MKHTESQYINIGFTLATVKGWRLDRTAQRIELMLAQETKEDRPEAVRLINIGKTEARR
jgi:hypothetical protein